MAGTVSHISKWVERSEADYYTMFIKTWIPFNAWYMTNYYDEDNGITSDRSIIELVMSGSNPYRDRIVALLRGSNDDADKFRQRLSMLHRALENNPIPNADEYISFTQVCISNNPNANMPVQEIIGRYTCKVKHDITLPRTSNRWMLEVMKTRTSETVYLIQLKRCSQHELSHNVDFSNITDGKIKGALQKCLNRISPTKTTDVTIMPKEKGGVLVKPRNCIVIDAAHSIYFCNNIDNVARAIISVTD